MEAPEWLQGPIRGIPLINAYSAYRLSLLGFGIAIGLFLWWLLSRTRVGMMIRAGVDDRAMLAAAGVNVNLVFAVTFALGAGLAGFGGVIGAVELSHGAGRGHRLLLASLIVVIVGGMGSVRRRGHRRGHPRPGRDLRPGLRADLQRGVHLRHPDPGAGLPAARHHGEGGMSAAQWRRAMNGGLARAPRPRPCQRRRAVPRARRSPTPTPTATRRAGSNTCGARCSRAMCSSLPSCWCFPFVATPFFTFQVAAQSLVLGLIALSLTFLAGYGGMVSLAQMTVAGIAGYAVAVLGTSSSAEISLGWPWWVAVPVGGADRGGVRHADRLAVGAHRRHLHDHDHAGHRRGLLLPGAAELQRLQRLPGPARAQAAHRVRPGLARPAAVLLPVRCSARWPATSWCATGARALRHRAAGHARQPAAHGGAGLQRRRAPRRGLCAVGRCWPRWAASCWSGTTR